ncbi:MAG: hypothetical protein QM778_34140 [Myxococcales bacterium]
MIVVTGTKRSGTSMWMQILKAAGYPVLGEAFPRDWGDTIREANSEGFYESPLRQGIYYATNPHPGTGAFLAPQETRRMVVKVFASGLARSDLAYLDKVVASMRPFREYAASLRRLYAMEYQGKLSSAERAGKSPDVVPRYTYLRPELEWWNDNFTLLRDALIRRYPLHMVSYGAVLRDPSSVVAEALGWLGQGEREPAVGVVRDSMRTQHTESLAESEPSGLSAEQEAVFDELYRRVDQREPLDGDFIDRLNYTHDELEPLIAEAAHAAVSQRRDVRHAAQERVKES